MPLNGGEQVGSYSQGEALEWTMGSPFIGIEVKQNIWIEIQVIR